MKKLSEIAENIVLMSNINNGENYAYFEINGISQKAFIYYDQDFFRYINLNFKRYYID